MIENYESIVKEITPAFAFEQLSHMKGGPSIEVLLDLALGNDASIAQIASKVLKTQVFLYDADTNRLEEAYKNGSEVAKDIVINGTAYGPAPYYGEIKYQQRASWIGWKASRSNYLNHFVGGRLRH